MACLKPFLLAVLSAIALAGPFDAFAQRYPSRPIKVIVPLPSGGGQDLVARAVSERLAVRLGLTYYRKLGYDIRRDFAPITMIGHGTSVLIVTPGLKATSVAELIALAVATRERSPLLPDLPTMAEAGLPGFEAAAVYALSRAALAFA